MPAMSCDSFAEGVADGHSTEREADEQNQQEGGGVVLLYAMQCYAVICCVVSCYQLQHGELLAEDQAGFRTRQSTVEQIFNNRVIIEKHLQHQRDLFHNFIDVKKAFDRIRHAGLWQVLRSFNIVEGLIQAIQPLYEDFSSAVLLNSQLGEFFKTTVGVCQGCLLTPILFNLLLQRIVQKTRHDHHTYISIRDRPLCTLRHNTEDSAEQDQLLCGSTGTSSGNCQDMETCTVRTCQKQRQPRQHHPSGHLGGWVMPSSAQEMLDGQHQGADITAHAKTAHKGLLQNRQEDSC